MSWTSHLRLSVIALSVAGAIWAGCGVDATEVEGCQKIEEARCEQAPACTALGVSTPKQVDACKRFYRDQCLHGLAIEQSPGDPAIDHCVNAVNAAGVCAKTKPDLACDKVITTTNTTACGILEHPEYAKDCSFLLPPAATTTPTADAGTDADAASDSDADATVAD